MKNRSNIILYKNYSKLSFKVYTYIVILVISCLARFCTPNLKTDKLGPKIYSDVLLV